MNSSEDAAVADQVAITVRQSGGTNVARAGQGKHAKTASCTSDSLSAALCAAAKWFLLPKEQIVVARQDQCGFTARPIRAGEIFTGIRFEAGEQDFDIWVVAADGTVFDCQPSQGWAWCGGRVENLSALKIGGRVVFSGYAMRKVTVKYRIVSLSRWDASGGAP